MSRLTKRNAFKIALCGKNGTSQCLITEDCIVCKQNTAIIEKLAHYEDLEEQGRLIETIYCEECKHHEVVDEEDGWCKMSKKNEELREVAGPLVEYIRKNYHPHTTVIVDCNHAEVLEGVAVAKFYDQTDNGEKHARWVYWDGWVGNFDQRIDDATCSNCGYKHPTVRGTPKLLADYCPGCKAKMDKGVNYE